MTVSLMISTYNWPEALRLCLESVMCQRVMPDEILIADDGSGDETLRVVEEYARISTVPLRHIWHEDDGFRLAAIRNKAIAASRCDYIVQIDGDLILHPDFVGDHIRIAERGHYVSGSRAQIGPGLTERLLRGARIGLSAFTRGMQHRMNALRLPAIASWFEGYKPVNVRGCNMAFWRTDLIRVNGYDENFKGWGFEDSDLAARLRNCGITKHAIKFIGVSYHLYHPYVSRENKESNRSAYRRSCESGRTRCENGVDRYLKGE